MPTLRLQRGYTVSAKNGVNYTTKAEKGEKLAVYFASLPGAETRKYSLANRSRQNSYSHGSCA